MKPGEVEVVALIAEGAHARVHLACDHAHGRDLAIKVWAVRPEHPGEGPAALAERMRRLLASRRCPARS